MRSKRSREVAVPERCLGTLVVNGIHCPVTNLYDLDGDDTTDLDLAAVAVCLLPDGKWLTAQVSSSGVWPLQ